MGENIKKRFSYMNAAEVLDKVFDVYKHSFLYQVGLNFCVYTIGAVVLYIVILGFAITGFFIGVFASWESSAARPGLIALIAAGGAVILWLGIVYSNLGTAASSILSWQSYSNRHIDFTGALKNTFKSFLHIASVSLAEMIVVIPVIILMGLAFIAAFAGQGVFTSEYWISGNFYSLFTPLNILLFVIIILSGTLIAAIAFNYFALALPIAIFDRKHFFSALINSYHLLKGDFWRILGIRIVFTGVILLINYSFSGLSGVIIGVSTTLINSFAPNLYGLMVIGMIIQYLVGFITSILIMPLTGIFTAIIFFNQKIKKEGLDLAMQLEILERTHEL